jgi:predicted NACHT family NTPase
MVITGAPGAGKTVLAVQLMLRLLEPDQRAEGDPVPVRLTLAGWDTDRESLEEWITGQLVGSYGLSRTEARALVRERLILPVLDGLDEMDSESAPGVSSRAAEAVHRMKRLPARAPAPTRSS